MKTRTEKLLQAFLEISRNKGLIAACLEMEGTCKPEHIRYLAGPVIVHKTPWSDSLPKWIFPAIYKDRLEQIFAEVEQGKTGKLATPTEVMAYMYGRTLEAPLSYEWTQVYLWCGHWALTKHKRLSKGQTFWKAIGEKQPRELNDYDQRQLLERLQRDIRQTVIKVAASQGVAKNKSRRRVTHQVQTSLFDLERL